MNPYEKAEIIQFVTQQAQAIPQEQFEFSIETKGPGITLTETTDATPLLSPTTNYNLSFKILPDIEVTANCNTESSKPRAVTAKIKEQTFINDYVAFVAFNGLSETYRKRFQDMFNNIVQKEMKRYKALSKEKTKI